MKGFIVWLQAIIPEATGFRFVPWGGSLCPIGWAWQSHGVGQTTSQPGQHLSLLLGKPMPLHSYTQPTHLHTTYTHYIIVFQCVTWVCRLFLKISIIFYSFLYPPSFLYCIPCFLLKLIGPQAFRAGDIAPFCGGNRVNLREKRKEVYQLNFLLI